jgi:tetrapyrrole methylase family protein / MazG family protein
LKDIDFFKKQVHHWTNISLDSRFFIKSFDELLDIADRLLGPGGCPWDQKQTLLTLQAYLLEEAHELIEAIDRREAEHIAEELGDVFYALVFIGKIGEKEKLFTLADAMQQINEKLIRRHPHIFANEKIHSVDDVLNNWEKIKKTEKKRKTILDGIPGTMPMLPRCQKVIEKLRRSKSPLAPKSSSQELTETEAGRQLWELVAQAESAGIDAEGALRRYCRQMEQKITGE